MIAVLIQQEDTHQSLPERGTQRPRCEGAPDRSMHVRGARPLATTILRVLQSRNAHSAFGVKSFYWDFIDYRRRRFNPWFGKFPGKGNGNQHGVLAWKNPMASRTCWAIVHRFAKRDSWARTHTYTRLWDWTNIPSLKASTLWSYVWSFWGDLFPSWVIMLAPTI